jgi:hypothetical protein
MEYSVEVVSCYATRKETKTKTKTPYLSEAEARAAYERLNLEGIAEYIEQTDPDGQVTLVANRLLRLPVGKPEEALASDAYDVEWR